MLRILFVISLFLLPSASLSYSKQTKAKESDQALVVVELFTSQGCNLCPPADDVLAEFSKQENVLALSYSVDYWNYLGWKDTLAQPDCAMRQKKYNVSLGKNGVYTPQMIIQGHQDVIGSKGDIAHKIVDDIRSQQRTDLKISFVLKQDIIDLRIGSHANVNSATIWIIGYDYEKTVKIRGGELGGQSRKYHNVVQSIKRVGIWTGQEIKLTLSKMDIGDGKYDAYALLLQNQETGPIIAAAHLEIQ